MHVFSYILIWFCQLLNWFNTQADLMDLITEASCAARCFKLFTHSITGPDETFLRQHPDLTQPHCINQQGACSLCLEVCQWPRSHTFHCTESCQNMVGSFENRPRADLLRTCEAACQFSRDRYAQTDLLHKNRLEPSCPRMESWPSACRPHCQTDADCLQTTQHKCCPSLVCTSTPQSSTSNVSLMHICIPGVPPAKVVPHIAGRPTVKQLETTPLTVLSSKPTEETQYQLELDWLNYYNVSSVPESDSWNSTHYPAVFLVQLRQFHDATATVDFDNFCSATSDINLLSTMDRFFDEWRSLVWTTKLGAVLSDLRPGTWYQFRLLTISPEGHGGWSEPSQPVRVLTRPVPPSSPRNLSESRTRIFENHVDVTVRWQPPKAGNLPLKKYQISWRQYYGFNGDDRKSLTEYEANVPGDKTVYTIQGLQSATAYKIEVKAVSVFEGKELESYPVSLYLTTPTLPARQPNRDYVHPLTMNESCRCNDNNQGTIAVGEAFMENQQLKTTIFVRSDFVRRNVRYLVEWSPSVCIESSARSSHSTYDTQSQVVSGQQLSKFELINLSFQCHYKVIVDEVKLQSVDSKSLREWFTCFCTPSCQTVSVKSGPGPNNCTNKVTTGDLKPLRIKYTLLSTTNQLLESHTTHSPMSDASVMQPQKVSRPRSRRTKKAAATYSAILQWHPEGGGEDNTSRPMLDVSRWEANTAVRGVRVTWGPRVYEPVRLEAYHHGLKPLLDPERTQSKVLHPHLSNLLLRELQPETLYIVHVQMIGELMDGPVSTIFFSIPTTQTHSASHRYKWTSTMLISIVPVLLTDLTQGSVD